MRKRLLAHHNLLLSIQVTNVTLYYRTALIINGPFTVIATYHCVQFRFVMR